MFTFNDFLEKANIGPREVLLMRHRPDDSNLRRVLPWLAIERHEIFNAYQSIQAGKNSEAALKKATYLASFIGLVPGSAHFVGIYHNTGCRKITQSEYKTISAYKKLDEYGSSRAGVRENSFLFELKLKNLLKEWKGKLIIKWSPPERSWYRWADRNEFPMRAVLDANAFEEMMPSWNELILTWSQLQALPSSWKAALNEWRGIYLITDESDGKTYVGSAYGKDNLLGRWCEYARTGHGGNRDLRGRNPAKFRFSILQRVSPDMDEEEVIRLENTWKKRLHTREFGLNGN